MGALLAYRKVRYTMQVMKRHTVLGGCEGLEYRNRTNSKLSCRHICVFAEAQTPLAWGVSERK